MGRHRRRVGKACIRDVVLTDARARRPVNRKPPTRRRNRTPKPSPQVPPLPALRSQLRGVRRGPRGPRYYRIDADDNEALADEHSVSKLPTFQLFKNGELASTFRGRPDESKLLAWARSEVPPFSVREL